MAKKKLPVILKSPARDEYDDACAFNEQRRKGAGNDLAKKLRAEFKSIAANPRMHATVLGDVRKAKVTKYPYCIYYRVLPDRIEVISVFHTSRDPNIWQSRV